MKNDFFAYFIKGNKIQAVAAQSRHVDALTYFQAFNKNKLPSASDVKSGKVTPKILREQFKKEGDIGMGCSRS